MYVIGQSFTGAPTAFNKFNEVLNVSEPGYYSLSIKVDSEYENISPRANYMLNVLGTDVVAPTTVSSVYKNGHLFVTYNITEEALTSLKTNASTFRIYMYSFKTADGSNVPVTLSEFMFVKGNYASDTMPSYEPNGYKIPIVSNGKNLFDPEMLKHSCYKVDNNKLTVTCNNGTAWNSLNYLALSPNTQYTLSVENKSLIDVRTPANVRLISQMTGTDVTFTTDSTGLVVVKFFEQENKYPYEVGFVQLEQSSKPSIYVDYVEPLISNIYLDEPLRKVGNVADYIDFENKTIVRRVGRFNEINSLNWSLSSNYFQAALGFNVNVENRVGSLSNYLLYGDARSDKAFWIDSSGTGIRIVNSDYSDLTSFNEWLNTLNMYVIYPLASKKEEKLELPNIPTFEGNTTIKVNTPIAPSNIDIKYNSR